MKKPMGDQFKKDRRLRQAKRMFKEVLSDYQKKIQHPTPSSKLLRKAYQKLLMQTGKFRGRDLFFPYISSGLGNGALVELKDASVKYDFITGIGVHYMGHSHPKIMEACMDAAWEDTVMQGNLQFSEIGAQVSELLIRGAKSKGAKLDYCFLTSSGAMANENALKIIFQKKAPANRFLAFRRCFSGRSMAMAHMTDKPQYRVGLPKMIQVDYIPFYDAKNPKESTQKSLDALKKLLNKHKGKYAGMCMELIQGEGGYYPGSHDFFVAIMKLLRKHGVAVMIDEIQTFGRTEEMFAFQYFKLDAYVDVVTIGKMSQVCATLFRKSFNPKPGLLSQTFTSSTTALYASKVILDELLSGGYLGKKGKIAQMSKYFMGHLEKLSQKYPKLLSGPFGLGGMIAFTFKDGDPKVTKQFLMKLYDAGVMGFISGQNPMRIRFLMPMGCVRRKDITQVVTIIEQTLKQSGEQTCS